MMTNSAAGIQRLKAGPAMRQSLQQLIALTLAAEEQEPNNEHQVLIRAVRVVAEQLLALITPLFEADRTQDPSSADQDALLGKTILIVDDNPVNLNLARAQFHSWGCNAITIQSLKDALEATELYPIDAIVIDLDAFGNGPEALNKLALTSGKRAFTILGLLNAETSNLEHIKHASEVDALRYKPFTPADLFDAVTRILNQTRHNAEPSNAAPEQVAVHLDLTLLEANALGQPEFVPNMLNLSLDVIPTYLKSLHEAFLNEALRDVWFNAHKIKSSAAMLGATELVEVLQTIEDAIDTAHTQDVLPILLDEATRLSHATLEAIQRALPNYESTSPDTPLH